MHFFSSTKHCSNFQVLFIKAPLLWSFMILCLRYTLSSKSPTQKLHKSSSSASIVSCSLFPGRVHLQVETAESLRPFILSVIKQNLTVSQSQKVHIKKMIHICIVIVVFHLWVTWLFVLTLCFTCLLFCFNFCRLAVVKLLIRRDFSQDGGSNAGPADVSQNVAEQMETETCPPAQEGSRGAAGCVPARPWEGAVLSKLLSLSHSFSWQFCVCLHETDMDKCLCISNARKLDPHTIRKYTLPRRHQLTHTGCKKSFLS